MTRDRLFEFSTGIRPQRISDGSWVSLGFTGQYINVTDSIPNPIERSIANKEFAVAEGASSDQPAIIGRVVQGANNEAWSVVAIASRGWDEKGRSASFYRYLWCDGDDGLSKILAWIDEYKRRYGQFPVFDPFKKVVENNPYLSDNVTVERPPSEFLDSSVPIILKPNQSYTLQQIHALAKEKAVVQPVSWAYNAEALEQPWRFVVIQAANDVAYERFQRAITNLPKVQKPVVADEQALRSAIKSLMGSSTVKQKAVEEIMTAIKNKEITKDYWHSLFDSQGAKYALKQGSYSRPMIRLLTLRTLVIPQTLHEYLQWLQVDDNLKRRNLNQAIIDSLEFQSKLTPTLIGYPQINQLIKNLTNEIITSTIPSHFWKKIGDYLQRNLSDSALAKFYYNLTPRILCSAIKILIGSSTVDPEAVKKIVTAISNKEITNNYWHSLFDSQGAKYALKQGSYSRPMIRLLTLRTLVIPKTLHEYLQWLQVDDNLKRRNLNQAIIDSLEFQSKLTPTLIGYPQINQLIKNLTNEIITSTIPSYFWNKIGDYLQKNGSNLDLAKLYYTWGSLYKIKEFSKKTVNFLGSAILQILFIVSIQKIEEYQEYLITNEKFTNNNYSSLKGVFLYTDEDREMAQYVKKNYESLDIITGQWLYLYLLEQPRLNHKNCAKYWKSILGVTLYEKFGIYRFFKPTKPFDKKESLKIANKLMVPPNLLPCLVLLPPLKKLSEEEKLIIPIKEVSRDYFRNLFTILKEIFDQSKCMMEYKDNVSRFCTLAILQGTEPLRVSLLWLMIYSKCYDPYEKVKINFDCIIQYLEEHSQKESNKKSLEYQIQETNIFVTVENLDMKNENKSEINFQNSNVNTGSVTGSGTINTAINKQNNFSQEEKPNLTEVAQDIEDLLNKLSLTYSLQSSTNNEKLARETIKVIEKNPTLKSRIISTLKSGGTEALKELVNHPAVNIFMELITGWNSAE